MQYSISDMEQLSGISVHNIRIWERRYNALQPSRTAGNTRYYDDSQLKRLLTIAGLYFSGHKISKACAMSTEETQLFLQKAIDATVSRENHYEYYISQIINHGMAYKEYEVDQLITQCFERNGVLSTYKFVMYPLLTRLGLMWCKDSLCPSHEHFLSSIFRQKLYTAINSCSAREPGSDKWLLFLPEDEDHDIGLLLASYLLKAAGKQVIYLGAKVPHYALMNSVQAVDPEKLLFFMTRIRPVSDAQNFIDTLAIEYPEKKIFLSGNPNLLSEVSFPRQINWLRGLTDFEEIIKSNN
ncbi:MAG TPA: MerR family transcriptional regulator [Mucilaginibacter sp.]|jgi:DNA-binding transcriptional MerR regulator|nr:MerR family transcriptional regulator [Mucilaginibacter sp.]